MLFRSKNINRVEYRGINLDIIQKLVDEKKITSVDMEVLIANGLAHKNDLIKVLGRGELTAKVDVKIHAISATAKAAVEAKGGSVTML